MIPPIYGSMAEEIGTRMIDQWMTWDDRFPNGINKKNNASILLSLWTWVSPHVQTPQTPPNTHQKRDTTHDNPDTIQTPAQRQESSRISRGPGSGANQMILDGSLQGWCALAGSTLLNVEPGKVRVY